MPAQSKLYFFKTHRAYQKLCSADLSYCLWGRYYIIISSWTCPVRSSPRSRKIVISCLHKSELIRTGSSTQFLSQSLGQTLVWFSSTSTLLNVWIVSTGLYYQEVASLTNWPWWNSNVKHFATRLLSAIFSKSLGNSSLFFTPSPACTCECQCQSILGGRVR